MERINGAKYEEIQRQASKWSRKNNPIGKRAVFNAKLCLPHVKGKLLNIGCGDGLETEVFIEEGIDVTGVDISKEKVEEARKHGINAVVGKQESLPFKDKEFDTVYSSHTLEHSFNAGAACSEMERVSSRVIVIVPIQPDGGYNLAHYSPIYTTEYLKRLLLEIGGRVVFEEELKTFENEYLVVVEYL